MQQIMTNFGHDKHFFFPLHHRITSGKQKTIPHISKDTFVTEKIHLNISPDKSQQVSVYACEGLEAVHSFYSTEVDLPRKITI